jgi:lysophospholipase L1-like esterase
MVILALFLLGLSFAPSANAQQAKDPCEAQKRKLQDLESALRDWPDLAKYRAANAELGAPAKGESRVVFLGDSITEAWDLSVYFPGKPYVNRGISGQTTPQILLRFRQDVIDLKPEIVVILAGTNDVAENTGPIPLSSIEDNLMSMVDLARKNGVRPILASILPAAAYPWKSEIKPIDKILELNNWMKEYAAKQGVGFVDYYSAMVNDKQGLKSEWTSDGVHPNQAGYAVMAPLVADAITKAK